MILAAYVVVGLIATATWTQLDAIGVVRSALVLLILFALERWPHSWHRALAGSAWWAEIRRHPWPGPPTRQALIVGLVVCAPLLLHLGVTLGEEFPYGGDEGYHFSAARTFARHLADAGLWLALIATGLAALSFVHRRHLATVAFLALWALSVRFASEVTFARYPAAFYFLATPFTVAVDLAGVHNPHVASHVVNTLAVVAWLFLLRPLVVRRWPDLATLVVGLVLFWQPTVVTYFGGGGLEPWSLILLLVALEAAVVLAPADRWIAVLLAGSASWFKEPAILALPIVWAIAMIEWRARDVRLRPGALPLGIVAATPFLVYYFVRNTLNLHRYYALAPTADLFSTSRAREWLDRMHLQFGDTGLVLLLALALFAGAGWLGRRTWEVRAAHVVMMGGALALVVFFYIDELGVPYTGYGRYLMYPFVIAVAALLIWAREREDHGRRRELLVVAALVTACQAIPLTKTLALDFAPDYARNSLEWHRCLIRVPFRALMAQLPAQPGGDAVTRVRLLTTAFDTQITSVAYPEVARAYTITAIEQGPEQIDCRCRDSGEAVFAAFEYPANFDAATLPDPRVVAADRTCLTHVEQTCRTALVERAENGFVLAALGVGVRGPQ